jgi:hypothetical protein
VPSHRHFVCRGNSPRAARPEQYSSTSAASPLGACGNSRAIAGAASAYAELFTLQASAYVD